MGVLRRPNESCTWSRRSLVGDAPAERDAAGGVRHLDGRPGRRRARRQLCRAAGVQAASSCCCRCSARSIRRISANLGDRTAAWLYDRLTEACVGPPGMGHLEDPTLTADLTVAREFDLGMTGPPLSISMDFIAERPRRDGRRARVVRDPRRYAWWAPLVLAGAWLATHWLLRESAIWRDRNTDEVRARSATRTTPIAWPSIRPRPRNCACSAWRAGRSTASSPAHPPARAAVRSDATARTSCHLEHAAGRLGANVLVFWSLASGAPRPHRSRAKRRLHAERHRRVDDRLRRIQLGARRCGRPGRGRAATRGRCGPPVRCASGTARRTAIPAREMRFRDVRFAYPWRAQPC